MKLTIVFTFPAFIILLIFALSNRAGYDLGFWPFTEQLNIPLYLIVFMTLLGGYTFGYMISWLNGRKTRIALRELEKKMAVANQTLNKAAKDRQALLALESDDTQSHQSNFKLIEAETSSEDGDKSSLTARQPSSN